MKFAHRKRFSQPTKFAAFLRLSVLFLAAATFGCSKGGSGAGSSEEAEHIGHIGALIGEYKSANQGNNPKNIDDLKHWAIQNGKAEEKDFISTRDKEEYVIQPMAMMRGGGAGGDMSMMAGKMPVILHESKGKNGKKYVVQGSSPVGSEMSEEGLNSLTKGRSDKNMKPPK
jgi:hypothetical protein